MWNQTPQLERELTESESRGLLKGSKAWMLQNIYDWDCGEKTNFWEIINDCPRKIEELPSKTRNQIRRSLRDCDIRIVTKEELVELGGYNVYVKAFERYHDITVNILDRCKWEDGVLKSQGREYWGVFRKEDGLMIAWAMNSYNGNGVNYNSLKAIPKYMNKHYPYFGLLFKMNQYYLEDKGMGYVSDGLRSITGHSNIQPFLEKNFLFRKAYCRMNVYYKPWLKLCIAVAYPFRKFIMIRSVTHLLNLEEIRRGI